MQPDVPVFWNWFFVVWPFVLLGLMSIGGYFMFRKFLKLLPMADGRSKIDIQNEYIEKSRGMWTDESKEFLEALVQPVPKPFRDVAKQSIAARIAQVALEAKASQVTREHCIEGYILATPKRDHKFLKAFLQEKGIDYSRYQHLM
ncbi:DUF2621 family protein [Paenibacillus thermoaerophilus]|uniref:DUF2621 family protein n=1 Tax=Paenibacillus thermoaerophilus TaxID=1215385 RepID=A0ABW2UZB1_9BACL|nr:DUF2621 family protein [Paenibacillus thermoaerophilus]TMV17434.1 DUF2621 family protein [Paenibacillus thermoaerophilus]